MPEPDAQQLEGQPAKELQSVIPIGNAQPVQNLVFPVTIKPDEAGIDIDGTRVALSPGMPSPSRSRPASGAFSNISTLP